MARIGIFPFFLHSKWGFNGGSDEEGHTIGTVPFFLHLAKGLNEGTGDFNPN